MIDLLIATLCFQLNNVPEASKYYSSCLNASNAASIQYSIKPNFDDLQKRFEDDIKKETGERIWWGIGMLYSAYNKGEMNLNVGAKPVVDSIQFKVNPTGSESLNFIWYF